MIKGCQREMIVLQTKESPLFESAYFVLRRGYRPALHGDMLAESNRIIGEGKNYLTKRRKRGRLFPFLLGFLLGGVLFGVGACIILC